MPHSVTTAWLLKFSHAESSRAMPIEYDWWSRGRHRGNSCWFMTHLLGTIPLDPADDGMRPNHLPRGGAPTQANKTFAGSKGSDVHACLLWRPVQLILSRDDGQRALHPLQEEGSISTGSGPHMSPVPCTTLTEPFAVDAGESRRATCIWFCMPGAISLSARSMATIHPKGSVVT